MQITDDGKTLFIHSEFFNSLCIPPYVKSTNFANSGRVHLQTTKDVGFFFQYVSSYERKMCDDCIGEALYDDKVDKWNAAFCNIVSHHPTKRLSAQQRRSTTIEETNVTLLSTCSRSSCKPGLRQYNTFAT